MNTNITAPRRALTSIAALGVAALAAIGLTLASASPALAHDELIDSGLEFEGSTGELSAVNLSFSNDIMDVGTEIIVTDEGGADVSSAEPEVSGPTVRQALDAPLPAGAYQVAWRVVSSDGHPIQGGFVFEVAADGSAEITADIEDDPRFADEGEDGEAEHSHEDGHSHDEAAADEQQGSGLPVGAWVAIGAAVVVAIGAGAVLATSRAKRRQREAIAAEGAAVGSENGRDA